MTQSLTFLELNLNKIILCEKQKLLLWTVRYAVYYYIKGGKQIDVFS